MSLMQGAQLHAKPPATAAQRPGAMTWRELDKPATWIVAAILLIIRVLIVGREAPDECAGKYAREIHATADGARNQSILPYWGNA